MTRWVDFWLDESQRGDWQLPVAQLGRFRLVGGALIGSAHELRFVPNTLEARFGARTRTLARSAIVSATLGRRRLRFTLSDGAELSFFVNRRRLAVQLLDGLLAA